MEMRVSYKTRFGKERGAEARILTATDAADAMRQISANLAARGGEVTSWRSFRVIR